MKRRYWSGKRGQGEAVEWLRDHANHAGDGCLIWPFSRNPEKGYGVFGHNGKMLYAHRFMCELVNGPAPTPKHEAAHECGNGHGGCVHPKHLNWKTGRQNSADRKRHGTTHNFQGRSKLTTEQVAEIRSLIGIKKHSEIAKQFGISSGYVYSIRVGRTWRADQKQTPISPETVIAIRNATGRHSDIAKKFGINASAVARIRNGQTYAHITEATHD